MKQRKFGLKVLSYVVLVDDRVHAAFDSFCPAREYAQTVKFERPFSQGKQMDVTVVDTGRFNQVVYRSINGSVVI